MVDIRYVFLAFAVIQFIKAGIALYYDNKKLSLLFFISGCLSLLGCI